MEKTVYNSAYNGDFDFVRDNVEKNPAIIHTCDSNQRLLIHWAVMSGNLKLVQFLLEQGSPVDPKDETEVTPLILAASAGKEVVCQMLISKGADVNSKTNQGHSALQYASSKGWLEIVQLLLKHNCDVNIEDLRGATPLHRAASKGNTKVVKLLLDTDNIDVNCKDFYGNTPLHLACEEDRVEDAKLLVKAGADIDITNKEGKTPTDLCTSMALARSIKSIAQQL